jgi:hypothetical protein
MTDVAQIRLALVGNQMREFQRIAGKAMTCTRKNIAARGWSRGEANGAMEQTSYP